MLKECKTIDEIKESIEYAYKSVEEENDFKWYSLVYPGMTKDTFKTFEEFKGKSSKIVEQKPIEKVKTVEEILQKVSRIADGTIKR